MQTTRLPYATQVAAAARAGATPAARPRMQYVGETFTGSYTSLRNTDCNHLCRHRLARAIAFAGATTFCLLCGIGLGALAGSASVLHMVGTLLISAWGCWGLKFVLTRH